MIALVRIALAKPYTFVVMAILILIFGVIAALSTPTDIFPGIDIPVVSIVWTYNGLPPDDMSGRVIYYYERSLTSTVSDIQHIESQSLAGYGIVKVFFQTGVNIDAALAEITAASQTVLKQLPPGITPPQILSFNASNVPILQLALSSASLSEARVFDAGQNFIRPQLATVPGAAIPSPYGGRVRQIQIDLDPRKMQANGLSAQDVGNALAAQNIVAPVGTEKIGGLEYTVELNDAPSAIAELNDLPIRKTGGTIVFMRDIAYVHDGSPPQTNIVRVDGRRAVLMTVQKSGSASTLDIIAGIRRVLPRLQAALPRALHLAAVGDQSVFVRDAVAGVIREGVIAASLTGLMILLFLGSWRSTLIITASIPLAILASVAALSALGQTINVMTLGGLALAVGILVDDATVTIENISFHLEHGEEIRTAILDGARQIVGAATVSLLCICIVFVPMFGLSGVSGFLFRPLAEAVVFAMIASFVLSRTFVPTAAAYLLRHGHQPVQTRNPLKRFQQGFEHRFEALRQRYRTALAAALGKRPRFLAGFLAVVLLSFALVPFLGQNFFPDVDAGEIKLHIRAPTGTRIEDTARLCDRIEAAVRAAIPPAELDRIVDNIGLPVSGINMAYSNSGQIGSGDADIMISLRANHRPTDSYIETLRSRLPRLFPGTGFSFLPADIVTQILNFGLPAPIDVQVTGTNAAADRRYAENLLKRITAIPGVADARIQQAFNEPTLNVDVDRTLASEVGLTERDVTASLQSTLAGSIQTAPTFWLNPRNGVSYPIVVQMPQYEIDTMQGLKNIPVTQGKSRQLLGALTAMHGSWTDAVASHYNVQPTLDIYATTHVRDLGAVAGDIRRVLQETRAQVPAGSFAALRGQVATMTTAYRQLLLGLGFAIVLIYLLIVINFQSWLDPFVIISALPAGLAGIVWMLFVTRTTLSVPALTGAIMCMGVATANSILIVSFARERLREGADALTAALDAGFMRFRPVLMTALAMIIGMAPMALSADQNAPLGRAVIGGLIAATSATLLFVPVLFAIVHATRQAAAPSFLPSQTQA